MSESSTSCSTLGTRPSRRYVVVWQTQADGAWKAVLDAPVSDPPDTEEK